MHTQKENSPQEDQIVHTSISLPPLPNSPISQRRERNITKETSPAIRIMIARYNQKLFEQENPGYKSGGSSGSASPVAWRSPVLERRVKTQSEKYQEELNKTLSNNNSTSQYIKMKVQKSASVGVMSGVGKQFIVPQTNERGNSLDSSGKNASPKTIRGILKSSSVDSMKKTSLLMKSAPPTIPDQSNAATSHSDVQKLPSVTEYFKASSVAQERAYKLQKAKEEFFQISTTSSSTPAKEENVTFPTRNRLSQVSFGSESSCDDTIYSGILIKSASAGMINIDEMAYEQFSPEVHSQGYVSLPRSSKKKDGKFGISSITSKFRKVKMRKNKESNQMNAVSALCRQSLVVDINLDSQNAADDRRREDEPSTSKTSWLKNPSKIFKPK